MRRKKPRRKLNKPRKQKSAHNSHRKTRTWIAPRIDELPHELIERIIAIGLDPGTWRDEYGLLRLAREEGLEFLEEHIRGLEVEHARQLKKLDDSGIE